MGHRQDNQRYLAFVWRVSMGCAGVAPYRAAHSVCGLIVALRGSIRLSAGGLLINPQGRIVEQLSGDPLEARWAAPQR